jgi:hypothetical protein
LWLCRSLNPSVVVWARTLVGAPASLLDTLAQPYTYRDIDIDTEAAARRAVRTLQRGQRQIQTVVRPAGRWLAEPSDDELLEAFRAPGHPRPRQHNRATSPGARGGPTGIGPVRSRFAWAGLYREPPSA